MNSDFQIYWEQQGRDALCGVHCLNSLLQGPYFDEFQLAKIAQDLDAMEKQLMSEGGYNNRNFLKYMAEDSGNVNDSGFYSLQVLQAALTSRFQSLSLRSATNEIVRNEDLSHYPGFICNLHTHWFSLRKINNE